MKVIWVMLTFMTVVVPLKAHSIEAFKIQLHDRMIRVEAPAKTSASYAVTIENLSLTDTAGKFTSGGKDLKFVTVKSTQVKTIEFTSPGSAPVSFQSLAPAFQEVKLVFGKGAYEIPPKQ